MPLVLGTLLLAGCASWMKGGDRTRQAAEPLPGGAAADDRAYAYCYPDEPPVLDAKGLQTFVGRFKPRVVVLDFWASRCRQSGEEMPELIRLQEELGTDQFQVVSCNLDSPESWSSTTVPFLQSVRANFPCVVIAPEAKSALRKWLAPNWSLDLPARFIVDSRGMVTGQALSDVAVADVQEQARRLVLGGGEGGLRVDAVALRVKLIDVRRGQAQSLPEVSAATADSKDLATQACRQLAPEIDRRLNARIAILPFPSSRNRARASTFGRDAAEQVRQELRRQGYYDLVGPEQTEKMIAAVGLTALAIDFEPAVVKERLNCDFLVLGWLRGETEPKPSQSEAAADNSSLPSDGGPAVVEQTEPPN